jgi:hypothetical protein
MLISPGSAEELAQTILFLASHPNDSARIGTNAQQYAAHFPSWEQVSLQFTIILNEILEKYKD